MDSCSKIIKSLEEAIKFYRVSLKKATIPDEKASALKNLAISISYSARN